jgi:hypothetical protein
MRARTRRKLEMGARVLEFSRLHPDTSPGYVAAATRLQETLDRATQLARQQLDGLSEVHAATARKRDLRRLMKRGHLDHVISVAEVAAAEEPELLQKFTFPETPSYLAFQTAASSIAAEAQSRKDVLIKHGLSEEVLSALMVALEQFGAAQNQSAAGRIAHVGATAELVAVADDVVQVVRVMNGLNRLRFAADSELLAAWESASNVVTFARPDTTAVPGGTTPTAGTPPSGGDVRPAA